MTSGQICLVDVPFTDGSGSKVRPVLVVSHARFNHGGDVIVVPMTSQPRADDQQVGIVADSSPHFAATRLKQSSGVKWAKPFTISKSRILRRLGELPSPVLDVVLQNLGTLFLKSPMT